jgi:LysR family transcriptional regulator, glycine cleavage system transcriptional activator
MITAHFQNGNLPMRGRDLPSTTSLRSFEAVARLAGCTRAAAELFTTPGAVSKQIKALEQAVGSVLFVRSPQGLTLTPAGAIYLESARNVLSELEAAAVRAREAGRARQRLLLHVLPTLADKWLLPRFASFAEAHSDIDVQFTNQLAGGGTEAEPDASLRWGDGQWLGCDATYLTGRELVLAISPAWAARRAPISRAADLLDATLLQHFELPGAWHDFFAQHGVRLREMPHTVRYGYFSVLLRGALTGMGIALVPKVLVADDLRGGALVNPAGLGCTIRSGYWLVTRRARRGEAAIGAFRDWLLALEPPAGREPRARSAGRVRHPPRS